jgi:hypothetical protein
MLDGVERNAVPLMRYELTPRSVRARARVVSATGTAAVVAPVWLAIVLASELGLTTRAVTIGLSAAVGLLGVARFFVALRRSRRRLAAFAVVVDGDVLRVVAIDGETRVPAWALRSVAEIDGMFGGLRVNLAGPGLPARFDVPRGGDAFPELRAWLAERVSVERAPRKSRAFRLAVAAAVVLALFFVPFFVADARGSRVAVAVVLLVAWGAMRVVAGRR